MLHITLTHSTIHAMVDATAPHRLRGTTDVMPVAPSPHVADTPVGEIWGYAQLPHLRGGELPRLSSSRKRRCARTTSDNKTCPTEPPTPTCATQQPPLFPLRCKHRHCRNAANLFITRYLRSCAGIGNRIEKCVPTVRPSFHRCATTAMPSPANYLASRRRLRCVITARHSPGRVISQKS